VVRGLVMRAWGGAEHNKKATPQERRLDMRLERLNELY
jgi:hypothetical protein